jgi:GTP cyclohydrolase I/GTP cyclohydrolase-4
VREQIRMALEEFSEFEPDTFIMARQENLETIHQHNVVAERSGLLGEMQREAIGGEHVARHVTMREWLDGLAPTSVQS